MLRPDLCEGEHVEVCAICARNVANVITRADGAVVASFRPAIREGKCGDWKYRATATRKPEELL